MRVSSNSGQTVAILDQVFERIARGSPAADCETATLDFKQDNGNRTELENTVVRGAICFANAAGGTIVVGVADRPGGRSAFRGTDLDSENIRQRIYERTVPHLLVDVRLLTAPARLLVIDIPASMTVHADSQGRSWQRVNRDCRPLTPEDVARLADERRGFDWSAGASGVDVANVRADALEAARSLLRNLPEPRRGYAALSDVDLLSALGVLVSRSEFTKAGALMFCANNTDAFLYQYRPTPGGEARLVERPAFPLLTAYLAILQLVAARQNTTPVTLPTGQQITIDDFPRDAVREALANALCHRDWRISGTITVDHAPEILSVVSPGPLVAGVTKENILTITSHPRNPLLTRVARVLGLAEETGRGIDRMFREAIRSGRDVPVIDSLFDSVRVAFQGGAPDTNIARFVAQLPTEEAEDTDTLLLLHHLCRARTVTAAQAAGFLQKPREEASMILRRLTTDPIALLEPTRESAARSWPTYRLRGEALRSLGAAAVYNRRTVDDIDRKVLAHIREYEKITNRTLQNFLDVDVWKARDILADLSKREILVRVSRQSRGPAVVWGPGPKFPKSRSAAPRSDTIAGQLEMPFKNSRRRRPDPEK